MAKIKLTKTELKAQTDALKRFQRFLPMLQLKKQQLQGEIAAIVAKAEETAARENALRGEIGRWVGLLATDESLVDGLVKVKAVAPVSATPKPKPRPTAKPAPVAASAAPRTIAELKARGYVDRGTVTKDRTAIKIAGAAWKSPQTYYTIRDKVIPGSSLDPAHIEKGMHVWMRK